MEQAQRFARRALFLIKDFLDMEAGPEGGVGVETCPAGPVLQACHGEGKTSAAREQVM